MGLLTVAIATLSAMRHVLRGFGTESLAGSKGLGPAAGVILGSRYQGLVAGFILLVLAAFAIVASAAREEAGGGEPIEAAKPAAGFLVAIFLLSSLSVLAAIALMLWEMAQASWLMRTLAEGRSRPLRGRRAGSTSGTACS